MDKQTLMLFGGIGAILVLASLIGFILQWRTRGAPNPVIDNLNARINAWWVMVLVIGIAFWLGTAAVILLFYAVSFYALREFLTLTPTRRSDYPALVAAFYLALPLQYLLIYSDWYGLFSIFIPVYVHVRLAVADHQHALAPRGGFALAVAGSGAAGVAGVGEVDAPAVVVDLAQAVGEDRQQGHVVACQDAGDALLDAVADHFDGSAQADHVIDEVGEVGVDFDTVEVAQQFGGRSLDQGQLAAEAFSGADVTVQPFLLYAFPAGVGEALENVIDHVGAGDGPVEVTYDMPVHHLLLPVE